MSGSDRFFPASTAVRAQFYNWIAVPLISRALPMTVKTGVRTIALDRRICVVREDRIDVRPSPGAVILPLVAILVSLACFVVIGLTINVLPLVALAVLLIPNVLIFPLAAMGLVYSLIGAHVVIDRRKGSATFQQGWIGLGLGTRELVPFGKIDHIALEETTLGDVESPWLAPLDVRIWDIVLVKTSEKRLSIGMVVIPAEPDLVQEGLTRARQAAGAIAALVERPMKDVAGG
jgi:hypothetical protein